MWGRYLNLSKSIQRVFFISTTVALILLLDVNKVIVYGFAAWIDLILSVYRTVKELMKANFKQIFKMIWGMYLNLSKSIQRIFFISTLIALIFLQNFNKVIFNGFEAWTFLMVSVCRTVKELVKANSKQNIKSIWNRN